MRGVYHLAILSLTSILFFQCQRELSNIGSGDQGQIITPDPVTSNLQGNIFDENGQPAQGVTIKVGAVTSTTDSKGYFRINNASLDKNQSLVTAEKAGYFKAYRSFTAGTGANQVVIKLIKRNLGGTVNGTSGGDVTLANGTKISLPADGMVKASDNSAYTGTVNVYASYIDPTASDILQTVPGSFMANDKDGKRVLLSSYGMMAVELESTSGEKLQIKSGSTATLTSPIPSAAQASAPNSIPLWFVDETTGLWKEEGTATKQGNSYVGTVKHFTYWNCDLPLQTIQFTATFLASNGQPLANASITVRPAAGGYYGSAHGYTDSLGHAHGPIPANMNLVLEVHDLCGAVIYSQNIGPFNQNVDLGTITVTNNSGTPSVVTIKGKLLTCSSTNVVNGYAVLLVNNYWVHYAAVDANGNFSATYVLCGAALNVQVFGVDATAQQQGNTASFSYATYGSTVDIGNVTACGTSSSQFINYTYDGTNYSITAPADSLIGYTTPLQGTTQFTTSILGSHINSFINFGFYSATTTNGTYPLTMLSINSNTAATNNPGLNVTITSFPQNIGEYYEGSFSGNFVDSATTTHTINCSFRVRRNF